MRLRRARPARSAGSPCRSPRPRRPCRRSTGWRFARGPVPRERGRSRRAPTRRRGAGRFGESSSKQAKRRRGLRQSWREAPPGSRPRYPRCPSRAVFRIMSKRVGSSRSTWKCCITKARWPASTACDLAARLALRAPGALHHGRDARRERRHEPDAQRLALAEHQVGAVPDDDRPAVARRSFPPRASARSGTRLGSGSRGSRGSRASPRARPAPSRRASRRRAR